MRGASAMEYSARNAAENIFWDVSNDLNNCTIISLILNGLHDDA